MLSVHAIGFVCALLTDRIRHQRCADAANVETSRIGGGSV